MPGGDNKLVTEENNLQVDGDNPLNHPPVPSKLEFRAEIEKARNTLRIRREILTNVSNHLEAGIEAAKQLAATADTITIRLTPQ